MGLRFALAAIAAISLPATAARADLVSELRLGLAAHAVDLNGGDPTAEDGADLSGEILFASPKPFTHILSPRPYISGSLNLAGDTDFWSFGLIWQQSVFERFFLEADFGLARHNGEIELPPLGDPRRDEIAKDHILFGSRMLFRGAFGVGVNVTDHWRAMAFYEHMSNGGVFGDSHRNQGLDNFGLRLGYRF